MIQEILTYLIIIGAFTWVGVKLFNTFFLKNKNNRLKNNSNAPNCGSCNADCTLRDTVIKTGNICVTPQKLIVK